MKKCDTISPSVQNKTITVDGVKYRLTGGVKDLPDGTRYEAIKPDLTRTMLTEAQVEAQLGDRG